MKTNVWGNPEKAKILVIGHDPRLQKSSTIANYCFFADYYFQPKPDKKNELAKYRLAESLYGCIRDLTGGFFCDDEVLITNLCNEVLPKAPQGRNVLIPEDKAKNGLEMIRSLLTSSNIKLVFAMSQQVNYWLQKLGFYITDTKFLEKAEPKENGVKNDKPYYEPKKVKAFLEICGHRYLADNQYHLFPILHIKNYPPKGRFLAYEGNCARCKKEIGDLLILLEEGI